MRFDLFSKRDKPLPDVFQYDDLPEVFRNQVVWLWSETIRKYDEYPDANPIFSLVHKAICTEAGRLSLTSDRRGPGQDLYSFFQQSDEVPLLLDIIEISFRELVNRVAQENGYGEIGWAELRSAVGELNHRFRENGIGFEFNTDTLKLVRVDSMAIHQSAIQPALNILTGKEYKLANMEMIEAFDDYKKADYNDCLAKCCTAMESVLKVILAREKWPHDPTAAAGALVAAYVQNSDLPSFFDQPLMIIATLRNRLSSAHGQGTQPKDVPEHFARYALNATTSAILLLHEHAK